MLFLDALRIARVGGFSCIEPLSRLYFSPRAIEKLLSQRPNVVHEASDLLIRNAPPSVSVRIVLVFRAVADAVEQLLIRQVLNLV